MIGKQSTASNKINCFLRWKCSKRNKGCSCSCSYLNVLHKKGECAIAKSFVWESWTAGSGKAPSQLQVWAFLFMRKALPEKEKLKQRGEKSLIKFIQAFAYWTWAFMNSDNMAMQTGVQVSESCKQVEHHSPALGNVIPLAFFSHALLKPFPHIPSPWQCTRTLKTRVSTWEGTGREGTPNPPPLRGHKSHENIYRKGWVETKEIRRHTRNKRQLPKDLNIF